MPRNGTGGYSLPSNSWNPAVNGAAATAADWQSLINDVATAIQQSVSSDGQTPMTGSLNMGGFVVTGLGAPSGSGQSLRWEQLTKGSDIASASALAIPNEGSYFEVTGTTTVNTFADVYPGRLVTLKFTGALQLTNSASLLLPQAQNITTRANDIAVFVQDSPGVWLCAMYRRGGAGMLPIFAQATAPTTDVGYIVVGGIGICSFDGTDNKYYRVPTYANRVQLRSASSTWTPDAFTKYVRLDGGAAGGGGGSGAATGGSGRVSGGGAGETVRQYDYTATPSVAISYTCGAAGAGAGSGTPATGTNGGNSTFGTLTLIGGSGGLASNSANVAGGIGGSSATPGAIAGQPGQYAQTSQTFGDGGSCIYGQGGRNNNPNGTGSANATGFCAGAGGTFGTNPNTAGAGFWDVYF